MKTHTAVYCMVVSVRIIPVLVHKTVLAGHGGSQQGAAEGFYMGQVMSSRRKNNARPSTKKLFMDASIPGANDHERAHTVQDT